MQMSGDFFTELLENVREGGAIMRGEKEPSRQFVVETPNVRHIVECVGLLGKKGQAGQSGGNCWRCWQKRRMSSQRSMTSCDLL